MTYVAGCPCYTYKTCTNRVSTVSTLLHRPHFDFALSLVSKIPEVSEIYKTS